MRRMSSVVVLAYVLCGAFAFAAGTSTQKLSRLSGSTLLVKYVAGTFDSMNDNEPLLGSLGCLETSKDNDGKPSSFFFVPYLHKQGGLRRTGGFLTHLADPSLIKGGGHCPQSSSLSLLKIPYGQIKVLARGQVKNMGQESSGVLQSVGALGGVVGLGTILSSNTLSNTV